MPRISQSKMAEDFVFELQSNFEEVSEITAMDILDTLGVCGFSFIERDDASIEFLSILSEASKKN